MLNRRSRIFLKLEHLQPSGSFKSRGVGHFCASHIKRNGGRASTHFYCSSGGNAGLACVVTARQLGYPATIVVPISTKALMLEKLRQAGAHAVVQKGESWKEADAFLKDELLLKDAGGVYVPPFDHEDIWEGNASLIREVRTQLSELHHSAILPNGCSLKAPEAVVCSVGGGGLFNGIMKGLEELGWQDTTVVAVETKGTDSLNASIRAGAHKSLPSITSIATSLGAVRVSDQTYRLAKRPNVRSMVLSDGEAVMGCWNLANEEHILVEPACGVNVALCYDGRLSEAIGRPVTSDMKIIVVVCGGSNVTLEQLLLWRKEFAS